MDFICFHSDAIPKLLRYKDSFAVFQYVTPKGGFFIVFNAPLFDESSAKEISARFHVRLKPEIVKKVNDLPF